MVTSIQIPPQIKSQEFISHIKQHFMTTSPVTYVTNGEKLYQKLGTPPPSIQQDYTL